MAEHGVKSTPAPIIKESISRSAPSPSPYASYAAYTAATRGAAAAPPVAAAAAPAAVPKLLAVPPPKFNQGTPAPLGGSRHISYVPPSPSAYGSYAEFKAAQAAAAAAQAAAATAQVVAAQSASAEAAQTAANEEWFRRARSAPIDPSYPGVPLNIARRTIQRAIAARQPKASLPSAARMPPSAALRRLMNSRKTLPLIKEEDPKNIYPLHIMEPYESRPLRKNTTRRQSRCRRHRKDTRRRQRI
jgi:hypothetical protein